jgi:hypothetical protein
MLEAWILIAVISNYDGTQDMRIVGQYETKNECNLAAYDIEVNNYNVKTICESESSVFNKLEN